MQECMAQHPRFSFMPLLVQNLQRELLKFVSIAKTQDIVFFLLTKHNMYGIIIMLNFAKMGG